MAQKMLYWAVIKTGPTMADSDVQIPKIKSLRGSTQFEQRARNVHTATRRRQAASTHGFRAWCDNAIPMRRCRALPIGIVVTIHATNQ